MDTLKQFKDEITEEYNTTKKFIDLFPEGKNDYAPHEKSAKMLPLATHITEIFSWPELMLRTSDLDFADGSESKKPGNKKDLQETLDENFKKSMESLKNAKEADLLPNWSLSYKGQKMMEWTKYGAIRHSLNQITHHRAQLGVYYRLLGIALPGSYGPSADSQEF